MQGGGGTLTADFLKRNQGLMVETRFFGEEFKYCLLAALGKEIDERVTGVMVRAINHSALNLILAKNSGQIPCIYIDPPYNTQDAGFAYKNGYKHSSWACMMEMVLQLAASILSPEGVLMVALDDTESGTLRRELDILLGMDNFVATVAIEVNPAGQNIRDNVPARSHDYCHIYAKNIELVEMRLRGLTEEEQAVYKHGDIDNTKFIWDNLRRRGGNSRPTDRPGQWFPLYVTINPPQVKLEPFQGGTEVWPIDPKGERRIWRNNPDGVRRELAKGTISVVNKAGRIEVVKKTLMPDGKKPKTLWQDARHSATTHGTKLLLDMIQNAQFSYPKSIHLVRDCIDSWVDDNGTIIDFFAGSGTTGHAVLNLNREDSGNRKFILVEVNDYFDTVLLPRILKATYSKDWKDGKPVDYTPLPGGALYKVLYLESYEDTLANINLPPPPSDNPLPLNLRREYTIRYMLDHETRQAVLDLDRFRKPFGWTMEVRRGGLVTKDHPVDLVETFNYLIGLHVSRYGYFQDVNHVRYVEGTIKEDGNDRRVLVLWRDCDRVSDAELLRLFDDREFAPVSSREYDRIYVNGDPPLVNIKRPDEQWKVLAIEDEFKRLSFADVEA